MSCLRITPLTETFAAEVSGIDLRQPVDDRTAEAIRQALARHLVLVFRDQPIDTGRHKAVAGIFGPLEATPSRKLVGIDEVVRIIDIGVFKGKDTTIRASPRPEDEYKLWHVDDTYFPQIPKVATLRPEALAADGGDTSWANMVAVFDALPPEMQDRLEGLNGVHSAPARMRADLGIDTRSEEVRQWYEERSVYRHPLVIRHPDNGRRSLFANPMFTTAIDGLGEDESHGLLMALFREAMRPEFVYRHRWKMGDLVIWDELATNHRGPSDVPEGRRLVRIYAGLATPVAARRATVPA